MTTRTDAILRAVGDEVALRLAYLDLADNAPDSVRIILHFNPRTGQPRRVQTQVDWQREVPGEDTPPTRRAG